VNQVFYNNRRQQLLKKRRVWPLYSSHPSPYLSVCILWKSLALDFLHFFWRAFLFIWMRLPNKQTAINGLIPPPLLLTIIL
jgi:hypothetical protein